MSIDPYGTMTPQMRRQMMQQMAFTLAGSLLEAGGPHEQKVGLGQALGRALPGMAAIPGQIREQEAAHQERSLDIALKQKELATAPTIKDPLIREFKVGPNTITKRYNRQTMKWEDMAIAPTRALTGKEPTIPGAMGKKAQNKLEESLIKSKSRLEDVRNVVTGFRPEFQTAPIKLWEGGKALWEKAGLPLSEESKADMTAYASHRQNSSKLINNYIRDMTGAQLSEHEAQRLKETMPNPGEGIWEGDSPTSFDTKLNNVYDQLIFASARAHYAVKNGFSIDALPLGSMENLMKQREIEMIEENPNMPMEQLLELYKAEFGL